MVVIDRLARALGAARYPWRYPPGADYVVLADPDDNLFCVCDVTHEAPDLQVDVPNVS
jgi:hypothetical protein